METGLLERKEIHFEQTFVEVEGINDELVFRPWRLARFASIALLSIVGFAYDSQVSVFLAQGYLYADIKGKLSEQWLTWITLAGEAFGGLIFAILADSFGRKKMLLVSGGFKVIGGVMTGTVSIASLFLLGRFIGCLGLGATVPLVTIYLSEIAPINIRGLVTASSLPVYGLSTLTACWVAYQFEQSWRWILYTANIPIVLQFLCYRFFPESPRWLMAQGRKNEANSVLSQIYLPEYVESAQIHLEKEMQGFPGGTALPVKERLIQTLTVFRRTYLLINGYLLLSVFSGVAVSFVLGPQILLATGFQFNHVTIVRNNIIVTVPTLLIMTVGNGIGALYMDSIGRRNLFLRSMPIAASGWLMVAFGVIYSFYDESFVRGSYLAYAGIIFFNAASSTGFIAVNWVQLIEILPITVLSTATGMCVLIQGIFDALILTVFQQILQNGSSGFYLIGFLILATFCLLFQAFYFKFFPETTRLPIMACVQKYTPSKDLKRVYQEQ